jgi:carbon-monoxide dehydrogenase small subunit
VSEPFSEAPVSVVVNGDPWQGEVPVHELLVDFLRDRLGLTGTKRSCEVQVCGACTVLVDGRPTSACSRLAYDVDGRTVTTVEGLELEDGPTPLQRAFVDEVAAQCGYCTSGQLMAATALLERHDGRPAYEEIAEWMSGNLCRCGCYPAIARAVQKAAVETVNEQPARDVDGY